MGLLRGALLASCAALALAAGTGKKVERQQCTAADAMVLKPFPHAHFKSWGHCEHISLGTVKLEGGGLTFVHPVVNTSTFNLQLHSGGELSASGVLDAPDFWSPSCNVSSCQMKGMLGDLDAAMRASDALLNESLAAVASVVDAVVAQAEDNSVAAIAQQADIVNLDAKFTTADSNLDAKFSSADDAFTTAHVAQQAWIDFLKGQVDAINAHISQPPSPPVGVSPEVQQLVDDMATSAVAQGAVINGLLTTVDSLQTGLIAQQASMNAQTGQIATLEGTIVAQGSTISQQHDQLSSLETTVVAQGATISGQAATISSLQMTVAASSMTMAVQDEKIFALEGQVAAILAQLSVLNSTYESIGEEAMPLSGPVFLTHHDNNYLSVTPGSVSKVAGQVNYDTGAAARADEPIAFGDYLSLNYTCSTTSGSAVIGLVTAAFPTSGFYYNADDLFIRSVECDWGFLRYFEFGSQVHQHSSLYTASTVLGLRKHVDGTVEHLYDGQVIYTHSSVSNPLNVSETYYVGAAVKTLSSPAISNLKYCNAAEQ